MVVEGGLNHVDNRFACGAAVLGEAFRAMYDSLDARLAGELENRGSKGGWRTHRRITSIDNQGFVGLGTYFTYSLHPIPPGAVTPLSTASARQG